MPICENKIKEQPIPSISEGDYNASEAAKIKRIRDQAYFNSYDFDAIEVLPSTSSEDDDNNNDIKNQPNNSHNNMSGKDRVITSMDNNNSNNNFIDNHNNNYLKSSITKSSNYFKRFTSLFIPSTVVVKSINNNNNNNNIENDKYKNENNENFDSDDIEIQKNQINNILQNSNSNYSDNSNKSLIDSDQKLYDNIRNSDRTELNRNSIHLNGKQNSGFSLPRAMLKSQSIGLISNSMLSSSASVSSSSSSSAIINSGTALNQFSSIEKDQSQSQTYNKIHTITIAADVIARNDSNSFSSRSLNTENETIIRSSLRSSNCSCITANCSCNDNHLLPQAIRNPRNQNNTSSFSSIATSIRSIADINSATNIPQTTIAIINTPSNPVSNQDQCKSISKNKNVHCYDKAATVVSDRERGNITSSSNYSTEKSGSSGYYSSNLCSASSVEEHIYSEPVIDIIDTSRISSSSSSKLYKLRQGLINLQNDNQKNLIINLKNEPKQQPQINPIQQNDEMLKMNENLRILEKSIKNLDLHLKNYHPKLNGFDNQSQQQQLNLPPITTATAFVHYNGLSTLPDDYYNPNHNNGITKQYQLPTIMEGIDNQSTKKNKSWTDEIVDDSLMDIDLDSFLLVNEKKSKGKNLCGLKSSSGLVNSNNNIDGIDNPSFDKTEIFNEEALESNYKCSKYVNSCPEDAYKVESDIGTNVSSSIIRVNDVNPENDNNSIQSNSIAFFLKKYEDQIHFQNTREMLEDIQDKIRNISVIAGANININNNNNNNNNDDEIHINNSVIPKELESNISVLKMELETYLKMMNRNSEMEIKQLCTGLVNNQKLVTLTKAFERRKSLTNSDDIALEYDLTYEPIRNLSKLYFNNNNNNSAINDINLLERNRSMTISNLNFNNNNNNSKNNSLIRSKRDPNFQLKRKSLTDIFPINNNNSCNDIIYNCDFANLECETLAASKQNNNNFNIVTQLQRNLSFHRPILEKQDIQNLDKNIKDDKDLILMEQHKNKPSSWELYYGTNRINQTLTGKRGQLSKIGKNLMSYPSSRPESDFTLDLPRAEQLRLKMDKEKKFRHRCRILTTFLSLVFFLLTVMVVSLVLTRGKRMFGSML